MQHNTLSKLRISGGRWPRKANQAKRVLCTLFATIAVAAIASLSASASGITEFRTTYVSGSPGPMQIVNWANTCDKSGFSTVDTTVGRSPATQFRNVTQSIGAYFNLFRWNGSSWVLTRHD